jgi:hypothetical protein
MTKANLSGSAMMAILLFEVMDKEPTLPVIWLFAILIAGSGFGFCRYNYKFIFFVIPITSCLALSLLLEIHDSSVGPAILREAGVSYVVQCYLATLIAIALPLAGAIDNYKNRRTRRSPAKNQSG